MKDYNDLKINDHKELSESLYNLMGWMLDSIVEDVIIEEHPENDGEKMFIDLTIKDKIDEETLMSCMVTAISILNEYDALYE